MDLLAQKLTISLEQSREIIKRAQAKGLPPSTWGRASERVGRARLVVVRERVELRPNKEKENDRQ